MDPTPPNNNNNNNNNNIVLGFGETALESLHFRGEIDSLMPAPPGNATSFTALLGLPQTQAMEFILHSEGKPYVITASNPSLASSSDSALIKRVAEFSVFAGAGDQNPTEEVSLVRANMGKVKSESRDTYSNPNSWQPLVSDHTVDSGNRTASKRKEREKKVKGSAKKNKSKAYESSGDGEKLPYVHVRARRGQATDSHCLAERARREKINARMKVLQELVPGCSKISGTALVLDQIINHVQSLQRHVEFLTMKLAAVDPTIDFDLDNLLSTEDASLVDGSFPGMVTPLTWPGIAVNGNRQHWHFDPFRRPHLEKEDNSPNFITPERSLLSYGSSANSALPHSNQLKMEH